MNKSTPPKIEKFPAAKQRRLDELLDKNCEGRITAKEKARLEQLVAEAEQLMVANGKRLAKFNQDQIERRASHGTPVTVWVQPQTTRR